MLLNHEYVNNQITEEIKIYLETNENENIMIPKSTGHWGSSSTRDIHSNAGLLQG